MYQKILSLLKSSAIRGQVLGDNRFHMMIVDEQFEMLAMELTALAQNRPNSCDLAPNWVTEIDEDGDELVIAHV